jgi:hypothetical protein
MNEPIETRGEDARSVLTFLRSSSVQSSSTVPPALIANGIERTLLSVRLDQFERHSEFLLLRTLHRLENSSLVSLCL